VLADAVNANVANRARTMVDKINGIRIDRLEDVVRAFQTNTNAFDTLELVPHGNIECLDRREALQANPAILKTYGIAKDRRL
jgi:hypothetical protein